MPIKSGDIHARRPQRCPHTIKYGVAGGAEAIRALIEEVWLVPDAGSLKIDLYGELAALINLANEHLRSKDTGVQVTMVAGARSHLYRTRKIFK